MFIKISVGKIVLRYITASQAMNQAITRGDKPMTDRIQIRCNCQQNLEPVIKRSKCIRYGQSFVVYIVYSLLHCATCSHVMSWSCGVIQICQPLIVGISTFCLYQYLCYFYRISGGTTTIIIFYSFNLYYWTASLV